MKIKISLFFFIIQGALFGQLVPNTANYLYNNPLTSSVGIGNTTPTAKLEVRSTIFDYFYEGDEAEEIEGNTLLRLYGDNKVPGIGYVSTTNKNLFEAYVKPSPSSSFQKAFQILGNGNVHIGSPGVPLASLTVFNNADIHNKLKIGVGSTIGSGLMVYPSIGDMAFYSQTNGNWLGLYNKAPNNGYGNPIVKSGDQVMLFNGNGLSFGVGTGAQNKGLRLSALGDLEVGRNADITEDVEVGKNLYVNNYAIVDDYLAIGTNDPKGYTLAVNGDMIAELVKVKLNGNWPDFVFDEKYELLTLSELKSFIEINSHLPGVPSEQEIMENDIDLGKMNAILLQKVEELTLYIIQLNEKIENLQSSK